MEILLKTKQSFNSQFDFLSYDNYLNPYYKHLQNLIKTNQIDPLEYLNEPSKKTSFWKKKLILKFLILNSLEIFFKKIKQLERVIIHFLFRNNSIKKFKFTNSTN